MKNLLTSLSWLGILLILTLVAASCYEEDLLSPPDKVLDLSEPPSGNKSGRSNGPWASGQAGIFIFDGYQNFAFHVRTDRNGNTSGTWEVKSRGQEVRAHGTLDCLGIIGGNEAFMTGEVTQVAEDNPLGIQIGDRVYLKVRDNGEGAKSPPDEFTDVFVTSLPCMDFLLPFTPVERGNIQVFPGGD